MILPAQASPRVAALLKKTRAARGRLIFALDATASREPTWDMAARLQANMFEEAAKIGGLEVRLIYYRGNGEITQSLWLADAHELVSIMGKIRCVAGATNIGGILRQIREHEKVNAAIFIGDAVEEQPDGLYAAARGLGVPLFMFQEGNGDVNYLNSYGGLTADPPVQVETVFRELARLTGGAYGKFDAGAAKHLGELLRAVAAFAVGGFAALTNQHSDAARKLLSQLK
jgi:hypothetical protein